MYARKEEQEKEQGRANYPVPKKLTKPKRGKEKKNNKKNWKKKYKNRTRSTARSQMFESQKTKQKAVKKHKEPHETGNHGRRISCNNKQCKLELSKWTKKNKKNNQTTQPKRVNNKICINP